jgi:subtilisin-like proprotein convertase family protein
MKKHNADDKVPSGFHRYLRMNSHLADLHSAYHVASSRRLLVWLSLTFLLSLNQAALAQDAVVTSPSPIPFQVDHAERKKRKSFTNLDKQDLLTRNLVNAYSNCQASEIAIGGVQKGNLSAEDCVVNSRFADEFTFTGRAGQKIAITMSAGSGEGLDPYLYLLKNGEEIASNDDFGDGFDARIGGGDLFTLPDDGVYKIRVTTFDEIGGGFPASGEFQLTLSSAEVGSPAEMGESAEDQIALEKSPGVGSAVLSPAVVSVYSSGNIATPIPDLGTVDIPINVSDTGTVLDINVRVRLNHTFTQDLSISLISPAGTTVPLATQRGGSGDNYGAGTNNCSGTKTVFDDSAATSISAGASPFAGSFRPESPLSAVNGASTSGTWRVRVSDGASSDTGIIGCVELEIDRSTSTCTYTLSRPSNNYSTNFTTGTTYWQSGLGASTIWRVNTQAGCIWSIGNNNPSMMVIDSGAGPNSGTGNFAFHPVANSGGFRSGTLAVNTPNGPSGASVINYQDSPNPPCINTSISVPQTISNHFITSDDCTVYGSYTRRYSFSGTANQPITISMTSSAFSPIVRLRRSDGSYISGTPGSVSVTPPLSVTLPANDTYTVEATSNSPFPSTPGTGGFTLSVASSCTYSLSSSYDNFQSQSPSLGWYWQNIAGGVFTVRVNTQPGCNWSISNGNPSMLVIDSGSGPRTGTGDFSYHVPANSGPFRTGVITINLTSTGQQTSVVNHQDSGNTCVQGSISFGTPVNSNLSAASDCSVFGYLHEVYTFTLGSTQPITVSMTSQQFTPRIDILDSQGQSVSNGPSPRNVTLGPGTYRIRAGAETLLPGAGNTGNFTLALNGASYPIVGRVTDGNTNIGVPNVNINVQGIIPLVPIVTDANGNYTFLSQPNGTYIVSASQAGYTFTPPSQPVTINNAQATANFQRNYPTPAITNLSPSETLLGTPVTLTINGSNFVSGAIVEYGGQTKLPTAFSPTSMQIILNAGDVSTVGPRSVRVFNPQPSAGPSNAVNFNVLSANCTPIPINYGEANTGTLTNLSCLVNDQRTDVYAFNGSVNDEIALTLDSSTIQPSVQLVAPNGSVIASDSGSTLARIPQSGFRQLTTAGTYLIRVSSVFDLGSYTLTLSRKPATACNYTLSPTQTNSPPGGGTFSFDILTGDGCPSVAAAVGPNSEHIRIVSNSGGRVTFTVDPYGGSSDRNGTITAGGRTHNVRQFGTSAPANDNFAAATQISGGTGTVEGRNTGASTEAGEPDHGSLPNQAQALSPTGGGHSVWYKWTAPTSGTYSFTTSGSTFDTLLAVYRGAAFGDLALVGRNDDTTNFDVTSKINFIAQAGTEYKIAVDGKNGATGSIQLSHSPFRRLYRLYLQNYNGLISTIAPDSVIARKDGTGPPIAGSLVSLGVYEFDLPADNSTYLVSLSGPEGITWEPATYTILNSAGSFTEMMANPEAPANTGNGQNQISNATSTVEKKFKGWIDGISSVQDLIGLEVRVASTGSNSAVAPKLCPNIELATSGGVTRARYQCKIQPGTTHQIIPSKSGKVFAVPVLQLPVLDRDTGPTTAPPYMIVASNATTASISGSVTAGGQPVNAANVTITSGAFTATVSTGANGNYTFENLTPGLTYTLTAAQAGYIFNPPPPVVLPAGGATVNITAQNCSFGFSNVGILPSSPGLHEITVTPNAGSENCGWSAQAALSSPWITINFGSSVGSGRIQYTVEANTTGSNRTGSIVVGGTVIPVTQRGGVVQGSGSNFDYDGDGRSDLSVMRPGNNSWYLLRGTAGYVVAEWGLPGDKMTPADFDGDGRTDVAIFRPSTGTWWFLHVHNNTLDSVVWGQDGDVPLPGDYDADGKADFIVYRPSNNTWYIRQSSNNAMPTKVFGIAGDLPISGDYDGDGIVDIAVFRPSNRNWYLQMSTGVFTVRTWGESGDILIPADYNGDGATDMAVYRPSNGGWYRFLSSGAVEITLGWGVATDIPAPADYDGDGKADLALFRPSNATWYVINSGGDGNIQQFGATGDRPTQTSYTHPPIP